MKLHEFIEKLQEIEAKRGGKLQVVVSDHGFVTGAADISVGYLQDNYVHGGDDLPIDTVEIW